MKYKDKSPDNLSNSDVIVLLVLQEYPLSSGYKIRQVIRESFSNHVFRPGQTSIYMSLHQLLEMGLVSKKTETTKTGKGPLPFLYNLTPYGHRSLKSNLLQRLTDCTLPYEDFDVGLFGVDCLNDREFLNALELRRLSLLNTAQQTLRSSEGMEKAQLSTQVILQRQLMYLQSDIEFIEQLLKTVHKKLSHDTLFV